MVMGLPPPPRPADYGRWREETRVAQSLAEAYNAARKAADAARESHAALLREAEPLRLAANRALRAFEREPSEANASAYAFAKHRLDAFEAEKIVPALKAREAAFAALDTARVPHEATKQLREAATTLRGLGYNSFTLLTELQVVPGTIIGGSQS